MSIHHMPSDHDRIMAQVPDLWGELLNTKSNRVHSRPITLTGPLRSVVYSASRCWELKSDRQCQKAREASLSMLRASYPKQTNKQTNKQVNTVATKL